MYEVSVKNLESVSGGWSAQEMGYATGYAIGSAYTAFVSTSNELGYLIYEWTH